MRRLNLADPVRLLPALSPGEMAEVFQGDPEVEARQKSSLAAVKAKRDPAAVDSALCELAEVIAREQNVMPTLIRAVKAYSSLGEITAVMRKAWGEYRPRVHI